MTKQAGQAGQVRRAGPDRQVTSVRQNQTGRSRQAGRNRQAGQVRKARPDRQVSKAGQAVFTEVQVRAGKTGQGIQDRQERADRNWNAKQGRQYMTGKTRQAGQA